jgi:hypothetical protein
MALAFSAPNMPGERFKKRMLGVFKHGVRILRKGS